MLNGISNDEVVQKDLSVQFLEQRKRFAFKDLIVLD